MCKILLWADLLTSQAAGTGSVIVHLNRTHSLQLRVLAPFASQAAPLQENRRAKTITIMHAKMLDVSYPGPLIICHLCPPAKARQPRPCVPYVAMLPAAIATSASATLHPAYQQNNEAGTQTP